MEKNKQTLPIKQRTLFYKDIYIKIIEEFRHTFQIYVKKKKNYIFLR